MFKVGDIVTTETLRYNFEVVGIKRGNLIMIKSPRKSSGPTMIINCDKWYLDEKYYRRLKLIKLIEKCAK